MFVTPSLTFIADAMPENARHIEELIAATKESDAKLQERPLARRLPVTPTRIVPRREGQDGE